MKGPERELTLLSKGTGDALPTKVAIRATTLQQGLVAPLLQIPPSSSNAFPPGTITPATTRTGWVLLQPPPLNLRRRLMGRVPRTRTHLSLPEVQWPLNRPHRRTILLQGAQVDNGQPILHLQQPVRTALEPGQENLPDVPERPLLSSLPKSAPTRHRFPHPRRPPPPHRSGRYQAHPGT